MIRLARTVLLTVAVALGGPTGAMAAPNAWEGGAPAGGRVETVLLAPSNPAVGLALAGGEVYRTTDGGTSWSRITVGIRPQSRLRIVAAAVDPLDAAVLYLADRHGPERVWRSSDGGANWQRADSGLDAVPRRLTAHPSASDTVYATDDAGGVHRTTDGGTSWSRLGTIPTAHSFARHGIVIAPSAPSVIYARARDGVFVSADGGTTWSSASTGLGAVDVRALAVDPADADIAYASVAGGGLLVTSDRGAGWAAVGPGPSPFLLALAVDPATPTTLHAAAFDGVFRSTDAGVSWTEIGPDLAATFDVVNDLAVASPELRLATTRAGVLRSTDGGASWTAANLGIDRASVRGLAVAPATGRLLAAVAAGNHRIVASDDDGATWQPTDGGLPADEVPLTIALHPVDANVGFVGTVSGVYRTTDGGASWAAVPVSSSGPFAAIAVEAGTPTVVYAASQSAGVSRSTDGGDTWTLLGNGLPGAGATAIGALAAAPSAPGTLYVGPVHDGVPELRGVYRSTDGGASWSIAVGGDMTVLTRVDALTVDPADAATVYAATPSGVLRTTDAGTNWRRLPLPAAAGTIALDPAHPGVVFASDGAELWRSVDHGMSWDTLPLLVRPGPAHAVRPGRSSSSLIHGAFDRGGVATLAAATDLRITVAAPPTGLTGAAVAHDATVRNLGPYGAADVRLEMSAPPGTSVDATPSQGSCVVGAGTVECALGGLASSGTASVAIRLTVADAGALATTTTVASATTELAATDNAAAATVTILADTDGDGLADGVDPDDDGDGYSDLDETSGGQSDPLDPSSRPPDMDLDRVSDRNDNCPRNPNPQQTDRDGDGIGDACEDDELMDLLLSIIQAIGRREPASAP
ncbi:MAG: thrombospondin type 3 repeat-containing protein [Chromatiales bacterium]|nr:thrombospondin type 3 repeat-containing protein [Chromatiales bacterium]